MRQTTHAEPPDDDPPHHAAGRPHDDHDPDPHPNRDAGSAHRPRGEEHERVVVARLRTMR